MKFGRVAICVSGLTRTGILAIESFRKFFSLLEDYDIFYHTWDVGHNTDSLKKLNELYLPTSYIIESPYEKSEHGSFGSMLYSIMMANELKKKYEIENNFRYDLVIRTRFDLVFHPSSMFILNNLMPRTIYCPGGNFGITSTDVERHGINDIIFWGDSQSMDIATNVYMYYKHVALKKNSLILRGFKFDPTNTYYSPGTLIYDICIKYNIALIRFVQGIREIPWRDDVSHLDPFTDYDKIRERYERIE